MANEVRAIGFRRGGNIDMSSLQGYIETSYADLVGCFGLHDDDYDDYKSDANWTITFADGVVATIYNWKNGKNYCGEEGLELADITHWHIGGYRGTGAVERVKEVMSAYLNKICVN
jgi:major membrane immunogen (membrane-anchored lipoprotein)